MISELSGDLFLGGNIEFCRNWHNTIGFWLGRNNIQEKHNMFIKIHYDYKKTCTIRLELLEASTLT